MSIHWKRRDVMKLASAGLAIGLLGQKAEAAALFGRMFAVPPRETSYFTPNDKFYVVNYSDSPFSLSRDVKADQWQLSITGVVKKPRVLRYADILGAEFPSRPYWKKSAPTRKWRAMSCFGPRMGTTTASRLNAPCVEMCCWPT